jgi:hypothetical protein
MTSAQKTTIAILAIIALELLYIAYYLREAGL